MYFRFMQKRIKKIYVKIKKNNHIYIYRERERCNFGLALGTGYQGSPTTMEYWVRTV